MLPAWRTECEFSDEEAEDISFKNTQLRRLIRQQKIQQLQMRKESLLQQSEDNNEDDFESNEDKTEGNSNVSESEWKILIQTLPIFQHFNQSEEEILSFNNRNRMGNKDPDLPKPKTIELKCTEHCPPGRKCPTPDEMRIFEVRRKPHFQTVIISGTDSPDEYPDEYPNADDEYNGEKNI